MSIVLSVLVRPSPQGVPEGVAPRDLQSAAGSQMLRDCRMVQLKSGECFLPSYPDSVQSGQPLSQQPPKRYLLLASAVIKFVAEEPVLIGPV
jgi:hypothetical protein